MRVFNGQQTNVGCKTCGFLCISTRTIRTSVAHFELSRHSAHVESWQQPQTIGNVVQSAQKGGEESQRQVDDSKEEIEDVECVSEK